jgi:hypothetical protein
MNKDDYIIHIYTENDTLLGRMERESNLDGIEDVNRVRRIILGSMGVLAATVGILAFALSCV